jgi:molybdopterin-guanine dinucleotide biosynthesis protein B
MKIFGFAGYSGSGKTTLIERLIPLFTQRGLAVSLIKHAHHTFDVDQPGKDSYRHRSPAAGKCSSPPRGAGRSYTSCAEQASLR